MLDLQVRHGPLPGLAADLRGADDDTERPARSPSPCSPSAWACRRSAVALLGAALRDTGGEVESDRVARLDEAAMALQRAGYLDAACRVYDRITAIDTELARPRDDGLCPAERAAHERRPPATCGRLPATRDRSAGRADGAGGGIRAEPWPREEEQAVVYWYYLLDARFRHDDEATKKFARLILSSGSTSGSVFLDVLPDLPAVADADEIDAYFSRVFEAARTKVLELKDDAQSHNDLAWLCARSGRHLNEAVGWATRAVELQPDEGAFLDTLAEAKFRTGKAHEAVEIETRALTLRPEDEAFMIVQLARFRAAAATQPAR